LGCLERGRFCSQMCKGMSAKGVLVRNRVTVAIALSGMLASYNAAAEESAAVAEARDAIAAFVEAVASSDVDRLKAILAPEFQLVRATGVGYDRERYIASELPTIQEWQIEDLIATASDQLLVARYQLVVDETVEGVPVTRRAPRLTVFRQKGDTWLVVAHATFATPR
jgi:ketosteroid isomerase-like protein